MRFEGGAEKNQNQNQNLEATINFAEILRLTKQAPLSLILTLENR